MNIPTLSDEIALAVDDYIAVITIDRPSKLNAMTPAMAADLVTAVRYCNDSDDVRAVVLTGAGAKSFSVGSDITALDSYSTPWDFRNRTDYCDAIRRLLKPTIAAVNGYALGGGLETALSCDIRIASSTAKFGAPEVKLGWIGGGGMTAFLSSAAGPSNAALMLMTGDPIDAQRALDWHLVSEVVAPQDLLEHAIAIARTIATRAPIAAETAKVNLRAAANMSEDQALEYERDLQTICFATDDAAEGRRAFAENDHPASGGVDHLMTAIQRARTQTWPPTAEVSLPTDHQRATLVGRVFRVDAGGPSVVTVRDGELVDITVTFATMRDLAEHPDPAKAVRSAEGTPIGSLADALTATPPEHTAPDRHRLLCPIDLQAVKAAGVTFVASMLERMIEERSRGDAERAEHFRRHIVELTGAHLADITPGSEAAAQLKELLVAEDAWSQYLEVGIGPDAEIFTKTAPMASVGTAVDIGVHPRSTWNNPEPEVVLLVSSTNRIVGATLGNDVNLRDFEGRSALLLTKAKDNNASCAVGPFVRLFDDSFDLEHRAALRSRAAGGRPRRLPPQRTVLDEADQP